MSTTTLVRPATHDAEVAKMRQWVTWSTGNYAVVGTTLQIVGEQLCETMAIGPDDHVLDVAAGNGNASLAAARRMARVTSTDFVPALLENGRARAAAEGLDMMFRLADAEALPFADASFDAVVSTFGVMFAADQERAAAEMLRVCRSGGQIGLASWTPRSFVDLLLKTIGIYLPPAPGTRAPSLWGTEARLEEMFGAASREITSTRRQFMFRYRNAAHWLEVFRTHYGPVNKAFASLGPAQQAALEGDVLALLGRMDCGRGALCVPGDYLETIITVR